MTTDKFQFTIGVTPGYFHSNENCDVDFVKLLDEVALNVESDSGLYISFNVLPSITVYKQEWGCPEGGEKTYTLSAIRNPKFNEDSILWKTCCIRILKDLATKLNQSTVTGEFSEVDILYWTSNN